MSLVAISTEDQNEALVPQGFHFLVNTSFFPHLFSLPGFSYTNKIYAIQTSLHAWLCRELLFFVKLVSKQPS